MKIKSVAAVGAMGVGLGVASFIGGTGTASADQCGDMPPVSPPSDISAYVNANVCNVRDEHQPAEQHRQSR